ncbi:MAG: hypothetical protein IPN26_00830 [Bacteroidetes bacterium]|nr:hypothetical protein [Bacteroidota bacterium]
MLTVTRSLYATNWVNEEDVIMANPGVLATFTISQDVNTVIAEDGSLHVTAENRIIVPQRSVKYWMLFRQNETLYPM